MTTALDAVARLDFDTVLPEDAAMLAVFEQHCRIGQPAFCLVCGHEGQGSECDSCYAAHDKAIDRAGDL